MAYLDDLAARVGAAALRSVSVVVVLAGDDGGVCGCLPATALQLQESVADCARRALRASGRTADVALRACIGARSAPDRVVAGPGSLVRQDIEVGIWAVPASPGAVAQRSDASGWAVGALAEFLGSGRPVFDGLRGAEAVVADGHSPDAYWRRLRHRVGHDPLILPAVAALVFREGGELLLVKTRTWDRWMIPGGAIELGETTAEAAVRKVRAETGLTVHPYALLGAYSGERFLTRYPNGDVTQHVSLPMLCHLRGGHMHLEDGEIEDIAAFAAGSLPPMHPQWERIARDGLGQALGLIE